MSYDYGHGVASAFKARELYLGKIRWKKAEDKIIKTNYKRFSDHEIQKNFLPHRTKGAVRCRRHQIGCHKLMQKHQIWTPDEIKTLKENYLHYNQRELQEKFFPNKTVEQVRSAKMQRGLKKPPVWTNDERGILLNHGANYSSGDLKKMFFPNKTKNQIGWMRKHLGVYRGNN